MPRKRTLTGLLLLLLLLLLGLTQVQRVPAAPLLYSVAVAEVPSSVAVDAALGRILLLTYAPAPSPYGPSSGALHSHLQILDLATGAARGAPALPLADALTVLAVAVQPHRLFVGGGLTSLTTLDTGQGRVSRVVTLGGPPLAVVVDARGRHAIVLCIDGHLALLDTRTGRVLRRTALGSWTAALALDPHTQTLFVSGRRGDGGWVRLLDAESLHLRRTVRLGRLAGVLAVARAARRVFVQRPAEQAVSMLDGRGTLLGTIRVGQSDDAGAVVVDERTARVFVANTQDDTVSVLDARSGQVVRTVQVGQQPETLLVDDRVNRIVVVNAHDGTLSVLDARTGMVRRTLVVGAAPAAAVDESTGHLVVSSTAPSLASSTVPPPLWRAWLAQQLPWLPLPPVSAAPPARGRVSLYNISP